MRHSWLFFLSTLIAGCSAGAQDMHPIHANTVVVATASGGVHPTAASITHRDWIAAAPAQGELVVGEDGQTYVGVWIDTPAAAPVALQRAPIDVALVIDNSGSMAGDKIQNARMAATSMLESLVDGDIVSIYTFESAVREVSPPTVVSRTTRGDLIQRVATIEPAGGTNLYGGLEAGEARVAQAPASHPVRRVVLISDGMANVGPSSAEQLGIVAARGTESGTQISAIGVGTDYDETTLGALAVRSQGRMYHLDQPSEMAAILHNELNLLSSTVAADAYLEVVPAPGVVIDGAELGQGEVQGGRYALRLGSLYAGQHRELLVRAHVDTSRAGDRPLATARLVYRDAAGTRTQHTQDVALHYGVTQDAVAARRSTDARVRGLVASYQAAQAQIRAADQLNRGQAQAAQATLASAESDLRSATAAQPASAQRDRMLRQVAHVHAGAAAAGGAIAMPTAARSAALHNNAAAMDDMGL